ncbi:MAG: polysaccharide biosynthesis tyrosine autokinase [Kiritimatiellae bacterium]|jgi:succinoglycan biosynthesis transport protein ExoP|nr:polysaccharide biosynthesis tyrosine autokinase [Kiritimatiellia bacterium]
MSTDSGQALHFLDYWWVIRSRKEIIIAVAMIIIAFGVIITFNLPKVYSSACLVEVYKTRSDIDLFARNTFQYDPFFLTTQFEIIQSRPVVEDVVQELDLVRILGTAYGYADMSQEAALNTTVDLVSGSMKVQQYKETNLIEIEVYMAEPKDGAPQVAADIANTIADVYKNQAIMRSEKVKKKSLTILSGEIEKQDKKVADLNNELDRIRDEYKITLVNTIASDNNAGQVVQQSSISQLENQRMLVTIDLAKKGAFLEKIQSLSQKDLQDAASYLTQAPALEQLVFDKRTAEVELKNVKKLYGAKHPNVQAEEAVIAELDVKINDALNGMKTGIQAEYEASLVMLEEIDSQLDALKVAERKAEGEGYKQYKATKKDFDKAQYILNELEVQYVSKQMETKVSDITVENISSARSNPKPVRPKVMLNIIFSVIIGVVAGMVLAFFLEYIDTSVKTIEEVEREIDEQVLGIIPQKVKPLNDPNAKRGHAEAYRVFWTNVRFAKKFNDARVICVSSGSMGEGKSLTLFNTAYTVASLGKKVLLIDCDLHKPTQHKMFGVERERGMTNVLSGDIEDVKSVVLKTDLDMLDFIPSGRMSRGLGVYGLVDNKRMKAIIDTFRDEYDYIFVDSPPIIGVSDAAIISSECDITLLVIQHRKYPIAVSRRAKGMLDNVGGNIAGVCLNNINSSRDNSYYYYYKQHYDYYPEGGKKVKAPKANKA